MLQLNENMNKKGMSGELFLWMYDEEDNLILHDSQKNLIVDSGLLITAGNLAGVSDYYITQFAFGDGTTTPTSSDTNLQGDYYRIIGIDTVNTSIFGNNIARIYWKIIYNTDIANKLFVGSVGGYWPGNTEFTVKEFGLYSTNNTLFNRIVWGGADLVMNKGVKLEGYFQITITGN